MPPFSTFQPTATTTTIPTILLDQNPPSSPPIDPIITAQTTQPSPQTLHSHIIAKSLPFSVDWYHLLTYYDLMNKIRSSTFLSLHQNHCTKAPCATVIGSQFSTATIAWLSLSLTWLKNDWLFLSIRIPNYNDRATTEADLIGYENITYHSRTEPSEHN